MIVKDQSKTIHTQTKIIIAIILTKMATLKRITIGTCQKANKPMVGKLTMQ